MTMTVAVILISTIVGLGIGFLIGKLTLSKKNSDKKTPPKKSSQNIPIPILKPDPVPADVKERIQALIDDGHKIGALKELRDSTKLELEKAKEIIDSMSPSIPIDNDNLDKLGTVRDLIRNGNKSEALDLYRESSGMTLKAAEEAVNKLEKEFGEPTKNP